MNVLGEFVLDEAQFIVSVDYVRTFDGRFEDGKLYEVYWAGYAPTKIGYCDAKILYMAGE